MNKITLLLLVLLSFRAYSLVDSSWIDKEEKKIDQILKKGGLSKENVAVYVAINSDEKKVIANVSGEKKMIPASISKLVTAATTLKQFPPGTKFKTQLLSSGEVEKGTLKGDIILKGGGDPSFVSETLWFLVNAFTRNNIKVIEGDVVVDDTYFDAVRFDQTRQKERVDRAYDAPTGAMSFNWNSVNIFVRPGKKSGEPAEVFADPENEYIRLKAKVVTTGPGGKTEVSADREEDDKGVGDLLLVSGKIAMDSKEVVIYKNVTQPDLWSGYNLKAFLRQRGIEIKGTIKLGVTSAKAKVLAEAESKPVEDIVADMNKFSNNYVAEMLTKNVGAQVKVPGTIGAGVEQMKKYLVKIGAEPGQFDFFNPSGLTRENKISAKVLWKVLDTMRVEYPYAPEFMKSLPIAGIDGTLKRRMKETKAERWVRAKTGFLTGVVSLAGYAGREDGTIIPFVFMFNGSTDEAHVRSVFDQIAVSLVE